MRMLLLAVLLFTQRPTTLPIQTGTVTGRLLNADGSPAVKVRVSAMVIPEARNSNDAPALITLTETDSTGRYRLADVPVGRYYIVAGFVDSPTYYPRGTGAAGATAVNVTARATTANIDFRIERPSTGLTISGRVTVESAQPSGNVQVMLNGGPSGSYTNLNVPPKLDGSFEFVRLRPGTYNISVSPAPFSQPRTVVVTEKDVTGLELRIPWTAEVSGRVVVEGGDPIPNLQISFAGGGTRQASSYVSGQSNQPNPTFRTTLAEGFYAVTASGIPQGFYIKSIVSGTTNLLTDPFRLSRTSSPAEIMITLGVSTPSPWVRLTGRVTGSRNTASSVTLNGPIGSLQASLAADGTFEFPKVIPGSYTAYTNTGNASGMQQVTLIVPNRDLLGIELALPITKEISGRIIVEDGGPLPRPTLMMNSAVDDKATASSATPIPSLAQLLVTSNVRSGQTPVNLTMQPDGTFKASLPEGQYPLSVSVPSNGAPPYSVKSFTYGTTDLLKDPLKVAASDSAEMQLTFSPTSPSSFAKVSGRVLGLTGSNATISMNNPSFYSALTTPVRADGTFEFPKVYSGTYQVRLTGPPANASIPAVEVNVASTDITNVEIVVPRQKEISGRIILEGRGIMPQFGIPLTTVAAPGTNFAPTTFFNVNPQPDGAFKLTLPEGERQVGRPNGLPPGYVLKSIFYGSIDLASSPLKVSSSDTAEFRVTVTTPDQPPVKVSGKVSGLGFAAIGRGTINVSLNATGYAGVLQAPVSAAGSFQFPAVFPGNYIARLTGPVPNANLATANVTVAGSDVTGVELVVPRQKEIFGRITLEGRGPMPQFNIPMNNVTTGTPNTANAVTFMTINPQSDGTFRVTLPEGERRAGTQNQLPAGYTLKTMAYGSTDLWTTPMKISTSDVAELRLTVSTPNHTPVKVSGKVSGIDATAAARGPISVVMTAPGYAGSLQTPVSADGSFEFAEVFPGNYAARVAGPVVGTQPTSIVVRGSVDVRNVEIVVPGQKEITGRVVVEGSAPMPRLGFSPSQLTAATMGSPGPLTVAASTLAVQFINILPGIDGTFRLTLPEGERRLGEAQNLPPGYALKAATYGTTDLLRNPLKIDKADTAQLVLMLTATGVSPVSVSGQVNGLDSGAVTTSNARVILNSASFATNLNALVRPDGSFEFPAVFPGNYSAQVTVPGVVTANQAMNFVVSDKAVTDLQLVVPRQHAVSARIVVEGGGPIPRLPLMVTQFESADGRGPSTAVVLNPQPDGTVRIALPEGRRLAVNQIPEGYSLKSLMYGDTDLRQTAFSPGPADTPQEVRITLGKTTPTPWVNVSGRVIGLPPDARNLRVGLNGAFTPPQQGVINADGTFSFTQVFQGNNTISLLGLAGTNPPTVVQFNVGPKDVTDLEIVVGK